MPRYRLLLSMLAIALQLTATSVLGASMPSYAGPALKAGYVGPVIVDNSHFRYTASDRLTFQTSVWIREHAPSIQALRPTIDAWASRYGVHPRLLSSVVNDAFIGLPVTGSRQEMEQVIQIAAGMVEVFRAGANHELAASRAVIAVTNALEIDYLPLKALATPRKLTRIAKGAPAPIFGFFQPPWEIGETWEGNGAHGGTGSGTRNSLDFADRFVDWGIDTSTYWLAATQSGTFRRWSSCDMAVIHDNGWITDYYHVDNIQVTNFAPVERNARLANYADNYAQATCTGGASDGPHVHVTMTFEDQPIEVDEANLDFTAFSYHVGNGQFDNNCNRAYYTHTTEGIVCSYERQLLNNAPIPSTDPAPSFAKSFAPSVIDPGGISTLTFSIDNSLSSTQVTALAFTDVMPTGMTVATQSNASTTCAGGSLTAMGGNSTVTLSGSSVSAGSSCTVSVDVTANVSGNLSNVSGSLTSSLGNSGTASDTLQVTTPQPAPGFSKTFAPTTIMVGEVSTLMFSIDNGASGTSATALAFTDVMPTGMTVAAPSNASTTCVGGSLAATQGNGTVTLSGSSVSAGSSCMVSVDVTASLSGDLQNVTGSLNSSLGNSGTASDTLQVTAPPPAPGFSKTFAPASIMLGEVSTLTFNIENSASGTSATGLAFTDVMPAGMTVAQPANASTNCAGGSLTAAQGSDTVSLSGSSVSAGGNCTVQVDVVADVIDVLLNTTGDLTSSLGNSGAASDSLQVTAPPPAPSFSKSFSPAAVMLNGVSTLTFNIDNGASGIPATGLVFTDVMPAGMLVAQPANASTTCSGGTLTAPQSSDTVSLSGSSVSAGGSCTVQVDIVAGIIGTLSNTTGDLTSSLGNSGTASDALEVSVLPPPPGFTKSFSPASISVGEVSTLTFNIDNGPSATAAAEMSFTDVMPSGMTVAQPANASTTCTGGSLSAAQGGNTISYTGATAASGTSCSVQVSVTASAAGSLLNTSGDLTSSLGNSGPAIDTLEVTSPPPPNFSKSFSPPTITLDGVSTLTFTIDNRAGGIPATALAFTDVMPVNMTVAQPANASSTCTGGSLSAVQGANTIAFSGASVESGDSCMVQVSVTADTAGALVNTSGSLTSSLGDSGAATDTLEVTAGPPPPLFTLDFAPPAIDLGSVTTLVFQIDNSASDLEATDLAFTNLMPSGLTVAQPSNQSITCEGGWMSAPEAGNLISLSGASVAAESTCIAQVDVLAQVAGVLQNTSGRLTSSLGNSGSTSGSLEVADVVDLEIVVSNGVDEVGATALVGYLIRITNKGTLDAIGAAVSVLAEGELSGIQWSCEEGGPGTSCLAEGTGNISDSVSVPAGEVIQYVMAGAVEPQADDEVTILGEVTAAVGQSDRDESNNVAEDTDPVTGLILYSGLELLQFFD